MRLGPLWFHRKEQWDLGAMFPFLCLHWKAPSTTTRLLCVWRTGFAVRRWIVRWG